MGFGKEMADELISGAGLVENTPCACKARVKDPSDTYPYDVKCRCEIEKPDMTELPKLTVGGTTELQGAAYLGFCPFVNNLGAPLQNGFYQSKGPVPGAVPDKTHPWTHLVNVRHSSKGNNHQMQFASSYAVNDRLFFRKIASELKPTNTEWNELAMRSGENTFQGQQTVQVTPNDGNGNTVGIELVQEDSVPPKAKTQHPSIRFHHMYRFWHRLEARTSGLHVKVGKEDQDAYSPIYASHFASVSDMMAKTNIRGLESMLEKLGKLKTYRYDLVGHGYDKPQHTPGVGVMAQELAEIIPEAVHRDQETGQHFVDYNIVSTANVKAVQELAEKEAKDKAELEHEIASLKDEVAELKAQVKLLLAAKKN